jgi:hypothetical protein
VDVTENSAAPAPAEQQKPKMGRPLGSKTRRAPYNLIRPKGVLATLSDERRAQLHQWLKNSPQLTYFEICRRIKAEWNLQVWPPTISRYYSRFVADEVIEERQKSVGVVALVNEDIDKNPADYAKAILDLLGDKTFDAVGNPAAHPKVVANWIHIFNNLRASEKNLELRERDLAAKERELDLKEKKFEEAQKTVADPKLSAAEIGARCRQIFAPLFNEKAEDDPQEFLPAFFENGNSPS